MAVRDPVFQVYVAAPDATSVAVLPLQINAELIVIVGALFTVTVVVLILVQVPVVPVTV